jgi:hypothetical protein
VLGELFDDLALEVGVEDFADTDHRGIVAGPGGGGAPNVAREGVSFAPVGVGILSESAVTAF